MLTAFDRGVIVRPMFDTILSNRRKKIKTDLQEYFSQIGVI